jgi:HTH-type transcriptional regulator/antitoxin HipB
MEPPASPADLIDGVKIMTVANLGDLIQRIRKDQGLTQLDISGLAHTGNRFIVDLEKGKPTIQMQKALDVLALLGLELVVRKKGAP